MYFRYKGKDIGHRYGPGTGPIQLDNVHCLGNETSLADCGIDWHTGDCSHSQDVSVSCGTSPYVMSIDIMPIVSNYETLREHVQNGRVLTEYGDLLGSRTAY